MAFDPLTAILNIGTTLIDRLIPDKTQANAAKAQFVQMQLQGEFDLMKGQLAVNQTEAANVNVFVAGWRPYIGWTLGTALAYGLVLQPFIVMALVMFHSSFDPAKLPVLDRTTILELLGTMLGMGILRSVDKSQGTDNGH